MPWKLAAYNTVLLYELTMTSPTDLVFFFSIWMDKIQFVITSFPPHHLVPRLEKSMKDESTDLQVLAALWHQPEAAPLKNEKAGLFCCFHIHLLLRNPIKLWKKVTFPFSVMTHGKRPLSGRRWEPLMRLVRWFWPKRKGVIDWPSQRCVSCTLSITCGPFSLFLFFALATGDHPFPECSLSGVCPHLTSLLLGWQPGSKGNKLHPSTLHVRHVLQTPFLLPSILNSPYLLLPFFLLLFSVVVLSPSLRSVMPSPSRPQMQLSSIDNSLDRPQWSTGVSSLVPSLLPPNSMACLCCQGHPAAHLQIERMAGCEWEAFTCHYLFPYWGFLLWKRKWL